MIHIKLSLATFDKHDTEAVLKLYFSLHSRTKKFVNITYILPIVPVNSTNVYFTAIKAHSRQVTLEFVHLTEGLSAESKSSRLDVCEREGGDTSRQLRVCRGMSGSQSSPSSSLHPPPDSSSHIPLCLT